MIRLAVLKVILVYFAALLAVLGFLWIAIGIGVLVLTAMCAAGGFE